MKKRNLRIPRLDLTENGRDPVDPHHRITAIKIKDQRPEISRSLGHALPRVGVVLAVLLVVVAAVRRARERLHGLRATFTNSRDPIAFSTGRRFLMLTAEKFTMMLMPISFICRAISTSGSSIIISVAPATAIRLAKPWKCAFHCFLTHKIAKMLIIF